MGYSTMTAIDNVQGFTSNPDGVGNNYLAKIMVASGKLASPDLSRGTISSVKVQAFGDTVTFTGCDSYRLIEVTVDMPNAGEWLALPNGKELAKASSFVKGQGTATFILADNQLVISSGKGSVNVHGLNPNGHALYPNVEQLFTVGSIGQLWPDGSVNYNGDLLGETLSLIADIVDHDGKGSTGGHVTIERLVPRAIITAERDGIKVRATLMPLRK
jgi:hypothetical protein